MLKISLSKGPNGTWLPNTMAEKNLENESSTVTDATQQASGSASGSALVGVTTTAGVATTMKNLTSFANTVGSFMHGIRATFRQENVNVSANHTAR